MTPPQDLSCDQWGAPTLHSGSPPSSLWCSTGASPQGSSTWKKINYKSKTKKLHYSTLQYNTCYNTIICPYLITHPPETASTVTLIGIPGFWPSGASEEYHILLDLRPNHWLFSTNSCKTKNVSVKNCTLNTTKATVNGAADWKFSFKLL